MVANISLQYLIYSISKQTFRKFIRIICSYLNYWLVVVRNYNHFNCCSRWALYRICSNRGCIWRPSYRVSEHRVSHTVRFSKWVEWYNILLTNRQKSERNVVSVLDRDFLCLWLINLGNSSVGCHSANYYRKF